MSEPNVSVFTWNLDADDVSATALSMLSADELDRASRFRFDRDRDRYINGRSVLRSILGEQCGIDPRDLVFSYGPQEKPELVLRRIHFNLAHSDDLAVLALAAFPIGIDVEIVRDGFANDRIAERFFAPSEVEELRALPIDAQLAAFFRCWTRKEAVLKALGGGLSIPLDSFTVAFAQPTDTPALLWFRDQPNEPSHWTLTDCPVDHHAKAICAIAARAPIENTTITRR